MSDALQVTQAGPLILAAFDPSLLGVYALPLDAVSAVAPVAPGDALAATGALAVLDGAMFDDCPGQNLPSGNAASYAASACANLRFMAYDAARGVSFAGSNPGQGITIAVTNGVATGAAGASAPTDASVAVQLYPPLVANGQVVASDAPGTNASAEWRAGLAMLADGRLAFAVAPLDVVGFAQALAAAGAVWAGYTDGGGSTALWTADGGRYGAAEHRRVATFLLANAVAQGAVPGATPPAEPSSVASAAGIALVVVGVAALGWAIEEALTRRRAGARRA